MRAVLVCLLLSAIVGAATAGPFDRRIAEGAAAAQALEGPLDGAWKVVGAKGQARLFLEITDPAGGGALSGAWRAPGASGAAPIANVQRSGGRLTLFLGTETLRIHADRRGGWRGVLEEGGSRRPVRLVRAGPTEPDGA
ncbi:MAG: hypothetical protein ACRED9_10535 [Caulobacteraceae bacterium]